LIYKLGGLIRFWNVFNTVDPLLTIDTNTNSAIKTLLVLPNQKIISGSSIGTIRIHQYSLASTPTSSTILKEFSNNHDGGNSEITSFALLNNLLVTSSENGIIRFWNLDSTPNPTLVNSIDQKPTAINSMIVLKNGLVVGCFGDGSVKSWNASNTRNTVFSYNTGSTCNSIIEMPNGNLVYGGNDGKVKIITTSNPSQLIKEFDTATTPIRINVLLLLPDLTVATGSNDGNVRVWDVLSTKTQQLLRTYEGNVPIMSLSRAIDF
jgi:WD40 repeat protein